MKLAAMGRLTASIAHEVRNPLSAINQAAQLLEEDGSVAPEGRRLLSMIRSNAKRIDRIVGEVLQLNRRDRQQPEVIQLGDFVRTLTDEIVQAESIPPGGVVIDITDDLLVMFDRGHLNQIAWNLVRNAWQHCQKRDGSIRIAARPGYMGDAVICELGDDGPGVPAEFRAQIFEPFFTTRPGGTGLGLYIARELADANGAALELLPRSPGAIFRMTFKRALTPAGHGHALAIESPALRPSPLPFAHKIHVPKNPWSTEGADRRRRAGPSRAARNDAVADGARHVARRIRRRREATARSDAVRPVPHRLEPARRRGLARRRAHHAKGARRAGGRHHRVRQSRKRRRRAQGGRVRLPRETGGARATARAGEAGAEGPGKAATRDELPASRRIAGDAARARPDRPPREEPGAGVHQRRVGQRQGARGADDPSEGSARRAAVHRGQLRRDPREPDGKRVLRLPEGRVHRRRSRPRRLFPGRERRHAVPRRSRRSSARDAGQAAARDPGKESAQGRLDHRGCRGHAPDQRHAQEPFGRWSRTASSARTSTTGCT